MTLSRMTVAVAWGLTVCGALQADGFRNPPDTAAALGKAGKCVVWVDDASAVFFNPANLTDVGRLQLQVSGVVGYSHTDYRGDAGRTETEEPWSGLPALAVAGPLPVRNLSFGLGLHVPYGRQTRWDDDGLFRYTAPVLSQMRVFDLSPALAWQVTETLSVGVGLDLYYGQMRFRQYVPWPAFVGGGEGEAEAEADGWGLGANAGVTWRFAPRQRLSLTCRTPFDLDFDGDLDVSGAPDPLVMGGMVAPGSDLSTTFSFPTIVALGYGLQVTDTLRVEADIEWLQFSRYEDLTLDADRNNAFLGQMGSRAIPQDWDDTWTFGVGADWRFAEHWTLRAGYLYLQTPTPDATFMPSMLDDSQSMVTIGLGFQSGRHAVDLAYALGLFSTRAIRGNRNPAYDGAYDFEAHLAALSYTFTF